MGGEVYVIAGLPVVTHRYFSLALAPPSTSYPPPPQAHSLLPRVIPALFECAASANPLLRHPALYGLGVCVQFGGAGFDAHVVPAAQLLVAVVSASDARSPDNVFATDNAMSALLKLARFRPAAVDAPAIMRGALSYLPLRGDDIEARLVHGWLIAGLAAMDPLWLGAGGANAPALLGALARTLIAQERRRKARDEAEARGDDGDEDEDEEDTDDLVAEATLATLPGIGVAMRASPMAAQVAAIVAGLPPAQQQVLAAYGLV